MQSFLNPNSALFALGFAVYFALLWFTIGFVVSFIGGWSTLAKTYRTERPFPANLLRLRSGTMRRGIGYHSALNLASDAEGLYVGVIFLFRLGHPRLFIPWKDISIGQPGKSLFLPIQTIRLGLASVPLTVRPSLIQRLLPKHP